MPRFTLLVLFLVSCTSVQRSLDGIYAGQGKDGSYRLDLKPESDFILKKDTSECKGKWMLLAYDSILLKCDNREVEEKLFKAYLIEKQLVVTVRNQNQLRLGTATLRRIK